MIIILALALVSFLGIQYRDMIKLFFIRPVVIENFDEISITDKMRQITVPGGAFWVIAYESHQEMSFPGLVGFTTPIKETNFALLTHDLLLTNGDFSNPFIIEIRVAKHRYRWVSWHVPQPEGSIYLIHAIPKNEEISQKLKSIRTGDAVVVKGYDIYRIDSFDKHGNYLSFWQDDGCNTLLVTSVEIHPGAESKSTQ